VVATNDPSMQLAYTSNDAAAFRKRLTADSLSAVKNKIFPSADRTITLPVAARAAFIFCLLGVTILQRFGVNFVSATVNFSLIALYILLFYLQHVGSLPSVLLGFHCF